MSNALHALAARLYPYVTQRAPVRDVNGMHWIFEKFQRYKGPFLPDHEYDFIGTSTSHSYLPWHIGNQDAVFFPALSDEYFEWIDVLLAAFRAREKFVMLEWGAGYGRWGVRGAQAARLMGIDNLLLGFAEAEPTHFGWLREHAINNGIALSKLKLSQCAVSEKRGRTLFYTGMPEGSANNTPHQWYGQCIAKGHEHGKHAADQTGRIDLESGWSAVEVDLVTGTSLLEQLDTVDILDMDIQGEEAKVVSECIESLNAKVKRLHIGTHSPKIEKSLRRTLSWNGWIPVRDFAMGAVRPTPYGDVDFQDGVQSWTNPRLGVIAE
jgi:FkbM family methyltransferase